MVGIADREDSLAPEPHQVVRVRQHRGDLTVVGGPHQVGDGAEVEVGRRLVDNDEDPRNLELLRHAGRDPGALEVLAVGAHDDQKDVGDHQRQERLLVEPGMRVDEEHVERELADELAQPVGKALGVVPLAQDPRDLAGLHARGNQEQPAAIEPADTIGDVEGDLLDRPVVPEEVVERGVIGLTGHAEEDVDTGRLDVGVDDADAEASAATTAARFAVVFDFPVPPRNEWMLTIVATGPP